jgi:hypothetical protein
VRQSQELTRRRLGNFADVLACIRAIHRSKLHGLHMEVDRCG